MLRSHALVVAAQVFGEHYGDEFHCLTGPAQGMLVGELAEEECTTTLTQFMADVPRGTLVAYVKSIVAMHAAWGVER